MWRHFPNPNSDIILLIYRSKWNEELNETPYMNLYNLIKRLSLIINSSFCFIIYRVEVMQRQSLSLKNVWPWWIGGSPRVLCNDFNTALAKIDRLLFLSILSVYKKILLINLFIVSDYRIAGRKVYFRYFGHPWILYIS